MEIETKTSVKELSREDRSDVLRSITRRALAQEIDPVFKPVKVQTDETISAIG